MTSHCATDIPFGGHIGRTVAQSQPWWAPSRVPARAPNVITIVLDVSTQQSPVLWAANGIDITQQIIELYDKKFGVSGGAAAPAAAPAAPGAKPAAPPAVAPKKPAGVK